MTNHHIQSHQREQIVDDMGLIHGQEWS